MPYPAVEPVRRPLMIQSWNDLTFLHFPYRPEAVERLVPKPLRVELFDGAAWVGIAPFVLRGLRAPFLPPLPWLSDFPETNCRTYVRHPNGTSGVWFFSLEAARAAAVTAARAGFGLPYFWARMRVSREGERFTYRSQRIWGSAGTRIQVEAAHGPIEPGEFDYFLTARFRLFALRRGRLMCARVEHPPWPLRHARVIEFHEDLTRAAGLPAPDSPPVVHFSPGVTVRISRPLPA
jgi:uncharacterized protein